MQAVWRGLAVSIGIGLVALVGSPFVPHLNEILLGLLLGVIIGNVASLPATWAPGIQFASSHLLNVAIIFLGFGISFQHMAQLGWPTLVVLVLMVGMVLSLTFLLARWFKCKSTTGWLVGFGTAICGASAVAALSGSVTRDSQDAGIAVAVVNLLGLVGMLALPALLPWFGLADPFAATLIGGSLHAVGNVAGAGYALSDGIGDLALTVKLGRVALLAPGLIFFNWLVNPGRSLKASLSLPYYIWGFLLAVLAVSVLPLPPTLLDLGKTTGKLLLTVAMVGIGLKISLRHLYQTGKIALGFGLVIFAVQIVLLLALLAVWGG